MQVKIKETIQPAREELILLRFAFDYETKKMQIEAVNKKYNTAGDVINSEPVKLLFRSEQHENAKEFCLVGDMESKILWMLLRKLEIDRKLASGILCDPLPEGVPPYSHE